MKMREALTQIAEGRTACAECGFIHAWHPGMEWRAGSYVESRTAGTWAGPDGHTYRQLSPQDLARRVLLEEYRGELPG